MRAGRTEKLFASPFHVPSLAYWERALAAAVVDGARAGMLGLYRTAITSPTSSGLNILAQRLKDHVFVENLLKVGVGLLASGVSNLLSELKKALLPQ